MHVMLTLLCHTNLSKLAKSMQFTNQIQTGIRHPNQCFCLSLSAIVPCCCKSTLYHHHMDVETKSMMNLANCKSLIQFTSSHVLEALVAFVVMWECRHLLVQKVEQILMCFATQHFLGFAF